MIGTLIASLLLLPQDQPRDIRLPVQTVRNYGAWLGDQTGRKVVVLPEVADRLVYINVKNRTLAELQEFIKQAVSVEALDRNGVITLRNFNDPSRDDAESAYRNWTKNVEYFSRSDFSESKLKEAMEEAIRLSSEAYNVGPRQRIEELSNYDPIRITLFDFLKNIGPRDLKAMGESSRVVYSTQPTKLQRPWIGDGNKAIRDLNDRMDIKRRVIAVLKPEKPSSDPFGLPIWISEGTSKEKAVVLMVVVQQAWGTVNVKIEAFDESTNLMAQSQEYMYGYFDMSTTGGSGMALTTEFPDEFYEITDEENLELERSNMLASGQGGTPREFTPADLEWLSHVDEIEPLSGIYSKLLDRACELTGNETVTNVNFPFGMMAKDNRVPMAPLIQLLFGSIVDSASPIKKNTLVINDGHLIEALAGFKAWPRAPLAKAARAIQAKGSLDIDILADAVKPLHEDIIACQVAGALMALSGQGQTKGNLSPDKWTLFLLRAYAELPPEMRRKVWSDEGITLQLSALPGNARALFNQSFNRAEYMPGQITSGPAGELYRSMTPEWPEDVPPTMYFMEQTVLAAHPKGQPTVLFLKGGSAPCYQTDIENSGGYIQRSTVSLEQLAANLYEQETGRSQRQVLRIGLGQELNLTLGIQLGQFTGSTFDFGMLAAPVKEMVPLTELPDTERKKIGAALAKIREYRSGGGRSQSPPPAP